MFVSQIDSKMIRLPHKYVNDIDKIHYISLDDGRTIIWQHSLSDDASVYDPVTKKIQILGSPQARSLKLLKLDGDSALLKMGQSTVKCSVSKNSDIAQLLTDDFVHRGAAAAVLPNGEVLLAGGFGSLHPITHFPISYLRTAIFYDPISKQVISNVSLHAARGGATAIPISNSELLVIGGSGETRNERDHRLSNTEIYNCVKRAFIEGPVTHEPFGRCTGYSRMSNGDIAVFQYGARDTILIYDIRKRLFKDVKLTITIPTNAAITEIVPGKVLITGGDSRKTTYCSAEAIIYDLDKNKIEHLSNIQRERMNHGSKLLLNGKVLLIGGNRIIDEGWSPIPGLASHTAEPVVNAEIYQLPE